MKRKQPERSIRISEETYETVRRLSDQEKRTIKAIVDIAVEEYERRRR